MQRGRNLPAVEIEDGDVVGGGIGDVGAMAVGRDVDEVRPSVDADGSDNLVLLGIDDADVRRAGVDHVYFVALRIGGESGRLATDLQGADGAKITQINDGDGITLAVRKVGLFAVERYIAGK